MLPWSGLPIPLPGIDLLELALQSWNSQAIGNCVDETVELAAHLFELRLAQALFDLLIAARPVHLAMELGDEHTAITLFERRT
jgi:hypothetical protein